MSFPDAYFKEKKTQNLGIFFGHLSSFQLLSTGNVFFIMSEREMFLSSDWGGNKYFKT